MLKHELYFSPQLSTVHDYINMLTEKLLLGGQDDALKSYWVGPPAAAAGEHHGGDAAPELLKLCSWDPSCSFFSPFRFHFICYMIWRRRIARMLWSHTFPFELTDGQGDNGNDDGKDAEDHCYQEGDCWWRYGDEVFVCFRFSLDIDDRFLVLWQLQGGVMSWTRV